MDRRGDRRGTAARIAYPALLGALSLLMLYAACLFPTGLWGWTAVAGLGPLAAVASLGIRSGLLCWGGVSVLAFLLLPDKFCAMLFAVLFGIYPVVKSAAERLKNRPGSWVVKLVAFNAALTVLIFLMGGLLMASLPSLLGDRLWLLYPLGSVVFVIYDLGLTKLIGAYLTRVDRAVRRGRRSG